MLFSDTPDGSQSNTTVAIIVAMATAISIVATKLYGLVKEWYEDKLNIEERKRKVKKEEDKEAIDQWKVIVDQQSVQIESNSKQLETIHKQLRECERKHARAEGRIEQLEASVRGAGIRVNTTPPSDSATHDALDDRGGSD